jgi:hypothetical protein
MRTLTLQIADDEKAAALYTLLNGRENIEVKADSSEKLPTMDISWLDEAPRHQNIDYTGVFEPKIVTGVKWRV